MEVSINGGAPKWIVYHGKSIKMDDLGVPLLLETSISHIWFHFRIYSNNILYVFI